MDIPKILIISFTDHNKDPRVHQQIAALRRTYEVTTVGVGERNLLVKNHIKINNKKLSKARVIKRLIDLKAGKYEKVYWEDKKVYEVLSKCHRNKFDLIIANDMETVPLGLKLSGSSGKVFLDLHEYEPKHWDDQVIFNIFFAPYWDYLCKTYLPKAHYISTVCEGIAEEYNKNYKVKCDTIFNTPDYRDLDIVKTNSNHFKMIHHGGINKSRKIENMAFLMEALDNRFTLDLMLVNSDKKYMQILEKIVNRYPRVKMIDPVPMLDIVDFLSQYDIGLNMLPPSNFNNRLALPNKIFEFIQANLALAIWPSQEMKKIIKNEKVGIVADSFTIKSMAQKLNNLTVEQVMQYKRNSFNLSKIYNSDQSKKKIKNIVEKLLN